MLITCTTIFYPSGRFKVEQNVLWTRFTNDQKPPPVKDLLKNTFTVYGSDWTAGLYNMQQHYINDISKIS